MPKIASVSASAHSCRFESDVVRFGLGSNIKRDTVIIRVSDDEGRTGIGESHHGQNPTAMAEIIENGLGKLIIGADPLDTEGIWERLRCQQIVTHGLGAGSIMGLSGIHIALWDLKGKIFDQPINRSTVCWEDRRKSFARMRAGSAWASMNPPNWNKR